PPVADAHRQPGDVALIVSHAVSPRDPTGEPVRHHPSPRGTAPVDAAGRDAGLDVHQGAAAGRDEPDLRGYVVAGAVPRHPHARLPRRDVRLDVLLPIGLVVHGEDPAAHAGLEAQGENTTSVAGEVD